MWAGFLEACPHSPWHGSAWPIPTWAGPMSKCKGEVGPPLSVLGDDARGLAVGNRCEVQHWLYPPVLHKVCPLPPCWKTTCLHCKKSCACQLLEYCEYQHTSTSDQNKRTILTCSGRTIDCD
eukprot:1161907-Pelagomonas_calceolata.AAC.7